MIGILGLLQIRCCDLRPIIPSTSLILLSSLRKNAVALSDRCNGDHVTVLKHPLAHPFSLASFLNFSANT
ncbi:hypothetical protein O181_035557 [Austropuccinia psidii MF-1]|uniref:Uncharacterized protein n=1 Tax=Austropuccinia psidii MF-1 TaxID=1389203 RepID=A0A9Q3D8V7_9BASI|nr:hypothetical protein [Austropuccinia psidii MF-1]